jgi:hypothetical protein
MSVNRSFENCTVAILGDSYSTFIGFIPEERECYYPSPERVDDVLVVEDTWWHQLFAKRNMNLLFNDSWSGSTVCTDVRDCHPAESAFVFRMKQSLCPTKANEQSPACVLLFGGTNDSWLGREIGCLTYQNWTEQDLRQVLPAYCYMLDYVCKSNPDATVFCILNSQLKPEIHEGILTACEHFGAVAIELHDINKKCGHPTRLGMQQIAQQINDVMDQY